MDVQSCRVAALRVANDCCPREQRCTTSATRSSTGFEHHTPRGVGQGLFPFLRHSPFFSPRDAATTEPYTEAGTRVCLCAHSWEIPRRTASRVECGTRSVIPRCRVLPFSVRHHHNQTPRLRGGAQQTSSARARIAAHTRRPAEKRTLRRTHPAAIRSTGFFRIAGKGFPLPPQAVFQATRHG